MIESEKYVLATIIKGGVIRMFLKLSETFKFFTRLGGKFSGLKSIRLGQLNRESAPHLGQDLAEQL